MTYPTVHNFHSCFSAISTFKMVVFTKELVKRLKEFLIYQGLYEMYGSILPSAFKISRQTQEGGGEKLNTSGCRNVSSGCGMVGGELFARVLGYFSFDLVLFFVLSFSITIKVFAGESSNFLDKF